MYTQHTHKNTFTLSFQIKPDLPKQWKEVYLTDLIL